MAWCCQATSHYPSQWWPIPMMIHIFVTELCHRASMSWIYSWSGNISACHLLQQLAPYYVCCSLCNRHGAHKPTWVFAPFAPVLFLCVVQSTGLFLGLLPTNEIRFNFVATSLIGWVQAQNQPWSSTGIMQLIRWRNWNVYYNTV